jgi:hypothetical protein
VQLYGDESAAGVRLLKEVLKLMSAEVAFR